MALPVGFSPSTLDPTGVRLTNRLQCPKCHEAFYLTVPRSGDGWAKCPKSRCRQWWWWIRLPAGAHGRDVVQRFGSHVAAALLRSAVPELATEADLDVLWAARLAVNDAKAFLQIPVEGYQYHRLMDASPEQIVADLGLSPP